MVHPLRFQLAIQQILEPFKLWMDKQVHGEAP